MWMNRNFVLVVTVFNFHPSRWGRVTVNYTLLLLVENMSLLIKAWLNIQVLTKTKVKVSRVPLNCQQHVTFSLDAFIHKVQGRAAVRRSSLLEVGGSNLEPGSDVTTSLSLLLYNCCTTALHMAQYFGLVVLPEGSEPLKGVTQRSRGLMGLEIKNFFNCFFLGNFIFSFKLL